MIDQLADPQTPRVLALAPEAASAPAIETTRPARILELPVRRPGKAAELRPGRMPRARQRRGKPTQSTRTFVSYQYLRRTTPAGCMRANELPIAILSFFSRFLTAPPTAVKFLPALIRCPFAVIGRPTAFAVDRLALQAVLPKETKGTGEAVPIEIGALSS